MHLLGSSDKDLLTCDGKPGIDHVNTSDRFSLYRQFKTLACVEPYIMLNLNRYIRYTLTRFRFGVSDIKVHRSRFKLYNVDELKCPIVSFGCGKMKSILFCVALHLRI